VIADLPALPRTVLLARLGDYLSFRARRLEPPPSGGASMAELAAMLRQNGVEALGPEAAPALDRFCALRPAAAGRPAATDNRMHAWEWLQTPDGRLLKADALDHCAAHDLVGAQPIAWDVVGAGLELGLGGDEEKDLAARISRGTDEPVDLPLLDFLRPCYMAFQLGYYTMAAAALAGAPDESAQLARRAGFYRAALADALGRLL
jgi:hypothetical protein